MSELRDILRKIDESEQGRIPRCFRCRCLLDNEIEDLCERCVDEVHRGGNLFCR